MATQPQSSTRLAFGPFVVNATADELLKGGSRIRLPGQPFQILLLLLAHPGEVVTREQLREQIWREGTFVDFEHGVNAAMNKLRRTLCDSADRPRYIETVPGRGYRFIGRVEAVPGSEGDSGKGDAEAIPDSLAEEGVPAGRRWGFWSLSSVTTWMILAAAGFGVWGGLMLFRTKPSEGARQAVQFTIASPPGTIFEPPIARQSFAISPDGTRLAFTATDASGTRLWVRDLAALDMKAIPGTEGARTVFWSPDSHSLFYAVRRQFMQANLDTGSSRVVARLPFTAMYGSWRSKNDLLLYLGPRSFYELLVDAGSLRELPDTSMRWAQFLPGTDRFVHVIYDPASGRYRALATDYTTQKSVTLMETDSRVQYAPPRGRGKPGHLLFIRGGSLLAQPFDPDQLRLTGEPFPLVQNVTYFSPSASGCFSVSENGVLVYQAGVPAAELRWYDRAGNVVSTVGKPAPFNGTVRISPDGRHLVAGVWSPENGGIDIWVFNEGGTESRRLTFPPAVHPRSVWSPEGTRIAFASTRTGAPSLATLDLAERSKEEPVMNDAAAKREAAWQVQLPTDWSRDGRFITYDISLGEEEREVWLADVSSGNVMPLLKDQSSQLGAVFSPDGKRVAFISDESGRPEVYVQSFEAAPSPHMMGERRQISTEGAWIVRWRPDGRELFYVGIDNWLRAVPVAGPVQFGRSKTLFRIAGTPQYGTMSDFQFDVTRDGQRFIMSTTGSQAPPDFTVIENWEDKFQVR